MTAGSRAGVCGSSISGTAGSIRKAKGGLWICPVGKGTGRPCGAAVRNLGSHLELHFQKGSEEVSTINMWICFALGLNGNGKSMFLICANKTKTVNVGSKTRLIDSVSDLLVPLSPASYVRHLFQYERAMLSKEERLDQLQMGFRLADGRVCHLFIQPERWCYEPGRHAEAPEGGK